MPWLYRTTLMILLLISWSSLWGQSLNPFELKKATDSNSYDQYSKSLLQDSVLKLNPFDLRKSLAAETEKSGFDKIKSFLKTVENTQVNPKETKNFLFWLLLFLSFLMAIALNLNRSFVAKLYRSNFNLNVAGVLFRENREDTRVITFILYGLYFAGLSVFIFLAINLLQKPIHYYYLIYITCFITIIYIIRHVTLRLLGSIFGFSREIERYLFNIVSFGSLFGIFLIPMDFLISFSNDEFSKRIVIWIGVFFILAYVFRQVKEILLSSNLWQNSIIHFLLYLCTFEIAPFLLLYEIFQRAT